ncbi:methylthioribose-1-phosphate isomerase [Klebsiella pneumoniae]|uniref:Methylthioribose-1-phosphate isomerase n=1 Tax=Klebsiella pneumoniae TaxID=573 RepID=A0A378BK61_KLEPN|nr:methylthioribose-1-phosphate isomerase [Klebsiella pneumoniae]
MRCWWTIFIPCGCAARPLIGLSASLLLALLAQRGLNRDALQQALETLRAARPTAVNLMNNLDRMKQALALEDYPQALEAEALRLVEEDKQLCDRIAEAGSALVKPGSRLLTHCNTGGLATAGVGTALGVIALAHRQGKVTNVWVDETRPLLQGGRFNRLGAGRAGRALSADRRFNGRQPDGAGAGGCGVGRRRPYRRQRRRGE